MFPPLRPCFCLYLCLLATCYARPNWHKGVLVMKDLPAPSAFVQPEYSEAEVAAVQAMRNAEEEAHMHMATMKQKYMDEVRQRFYNSLPLSPFIKQRLDEFEPNLHSEVVLPVVSIPPQPVYIHHTARNPCSGHILNCLHTNSPPRIGTIVPSSSTGLQPCFGPNCNRIFLNPQFRPAVIPKPLHNSESVNKHSSKGPHKHHHICDRKRPDQNCRGTFWPTYATVKLNTKLNLPIATNSQKEIHEPNRFQQFPTTIYYSTKEFYQQSVLPSSAFNTQKTPPSEQSSNVDNFGFETLRSNASKLENEILGISDHIRLTSAIPNKVSFSTINPPLTTANNDLTKSTSTIQSTNLISSTLETPELIPELKEGAENISPLKAMTTQSPLNSLGPETTSSEIFETESSIGEHFKHVGGTEPNEQGDLSTKSTSDTTNKQILASSTLALIENHNKIFAETTTVSEETYDRTEIINSIIRGNDPEGSPSLPQEVQIEFKVTTTDHNPEWKSENELMTTVKLLPEHSSSLHHEVKIEDTTFKNNQDSTTKTEYISEDNASGNPSLKTNKEENVQSLATTTMSYNEYNTRMFDSDLDETTLRGDIVQPSTETLFEDSHDQKEFLLQTTTSIVQDTTQQFLEYFTNAGREDTIIDTAGSGYTTPSQEPSYSNNFKVIEETTSGVISNLSAELRNNIVSTTDSLSSFVPSTNRNDEGNKETREETMIKFITTASSEKIEDFQQPQSVLDEIKDSSTDFLEREIEVTESPMTTEDTIALVSDFRFGLEDNLFHTTGGSADLNVYNGEEGNVKAREETITTAYHDVPASTMHLDDLYLARNEQENDQALSTQFPIEDTRDISSTTVDYSDNFKTISSIDIMSNEISTQTNDVNLPSPLAKEDIIETTTEQESFSDSKTEQLNLPTDEGIPNSNSDVSKSETESNYFVDATDRQESKINLQEETHWTTEKAESTVYYLQSREDLFEHNGHSHPSLVGTTLNQIPEGDVSSFTKVYTQIDIESVQEETTSPAMTPTEIGNEIVKFKDENENLEDTLTYTSIDHEKDVTTINNNPQFLQTGEGDEGDSLLDITSEASLEVRYTTDGYEGKTASITENKNDDVTQRNITSETGFLELRENIYESTTVIDFSENVTNSDTNKETLEVKVAESEDKPSESSLIIPEEIIGKTDSPGLIINDDFTEEPTEDTSLSIITEFTEKNAPTPHSKSNEDEYNLEAARHRPSTEFSNADVVESIESTNFKLDNPTTSATSLKEESSHISYQAGVVKYTSEIETTTENDFFTELSEGVTNSDLDVSLNDIFNRKSRSVKQTDNEVRSYPTTECMLCLLGLPHGHRIKRSSDPLDIKKPQNETNMLESEKLNCSLTENINLEDSENSSFYASMILELLPVIRQGYRNNAFSEEDKKVIRSIFGDMKALVDEDTYERISEPTGDLLMGDVETKIDEIIEETEYDSSDYEISENERLRRSKKHLQIMNDLLQKVPTNSKNYPTIPSQKKHSRVVRSSHVTHAEASAILALLAEKSDVQLDIADDEDDDEYEYYEDEGDEYADEDSYVETYEDDYDKPSIGELIKLAKKHKERKARAGES